MSLFVMPPRRAGTACPVSRALAVVDITANTTLVQAD
jgi:hypothetical protein